MTGEKNPTPVRSPPRPRAPGSVLLTKNLPLTPCSLNIHHGNAESREQPYPGLLARRSSSAVEMKVAMFHLRLTLLGEALSRRSI
jgi:hypothetical protein